MESSRFAPKKDGLLTPPETCDNRAIPFRRLFTEVRLEPTTATYKLQKPTTRVKVVLVFSQVVGKLGDSLGQQRDLHLSRTYIPGMRLVFVDDLRLFLF